MFLQLQNLKNQLVHVGAGVVVLGLLFVFVTWVALFFCAVAILLKAVLDHTLTMVQFTRKKGLSKRFSRRPRADSRKPDVVPTSDSVEEHTQVTNSVIYETAEEFDAILQKLRDASSRMNDTASKATDIIPEDKENGAKANYKYVTGDLKHQLHGIKTQGSRRGQKAADIKDPKQEQDARTPKQRFLKRTNGKMRTTKLQQKTRSSTGAQP